MDGLLRAFPRKRNPIWRPHADLRADDRSHFG